MIQRDSKIQALFIFSCLFAVHSASDCTLRLVTYGYEDCRTFENDVFASFRTRQRVAVAEELSWCMFLLGPCY